MQRRQPPHSHSLPLPYHLPPLVGLGSSDRKCCSVERKKRNQIINTRQARAVRQAAPFPSPLPYSVCLSSPLAYRPHSALLTALHVLSPHPHSNCHIYIYTPGWNYRYTLKWSDKMTTDILAIDSESNTRLLRSTFKLFLGFCKLFTPLSHPGQSQSILVKVYYKC